MLVCGCRQPQEQRAGAWVLGVSAPEQVGLTTVWLSVLNGQVSMAQQATGLHLLTPTGPHHLQEVAARASQTCTEEWTEECVIHRVAVVDTLDVAAEIAGLQRLAAAEVGCTSGHTLQRIHSVDRTGYVTHILDGGGACASVGTGYESLLYMDHPWQSRPAVPAEALTMLQQEVLASFPQSDQSVTDASVVVLTDWSEGVTRRRAAMVAGEGDEAVELSMEISAQSDATPFATVLQHWPQATGVHTAPSGEWAVIRLADVGLAIIRLSDQVVLWQGMLHGRVVMAEWVDEPVAWQGVLDAVEWTDIR